MQRVEHGGERWLTVDAPLEHLLVTAVSVVARGADLDLNAVHIAPGVNDQRPHFLTDVKDHELRVLARRKALGLMCVVVVVVVNVRLVHELPPRGRRSTSPGALLRRPATVGGRG
jgi:hypothetical protein